MRFYEYESRRILAREGIPLSEHGFATTPEEARRIAGEVDVRRPGEGDTPDRPQLAKGEVQTYCEEQERDPDLREQLYLVHLSDGGSAGVRANQDAREYVPQDQGQPEPPGDSPTQESGYQDECDVTSDSHTAFLHHNFGDYPELHEGERVLRAPGSRLVPRLPLHAAERRCAPAAGVCRSGCRD
jgi:hypothetical protein